MLSFLPKTRYNQPMLKLKHLSLLALALLLVAGCAGKQYPADKSKVKYANRNSPGSKLEVKSMLTPDEMNLVYFFADW